MKAMRNSILAAMAGVAAVGFAAPASADLTDGTYQLNFAEQPGQPKTMTITPCGDGCKHFQIAGAEQGGEFHLDGNTWTHMFTNGHSITIDNDTLAGTQHQKRDHSFQMVKTG